ncbi:hypothetical protein FAY30_24135 [Bacillus sp. S3]|uniref:ECF transporter S component n=1 Tax=Bacillus sp. S3 TaxID=486398 RepID=UPI0011893456|nr:ECF transporter S component [Bacillus sp. S3]QCJ44724.1 hypothetical protein FAY30_24135 [Bacillus sp. S3]
MANTNLQETHVVVKNKTFFTPKRMARMSILMALSAVGAFVKIPTPTGDIGIDSAPGYFAAMVKNWDWKEAQIIGIFARLIAAWIVGFPLGIPIQICWGVFLGGCMGVYARLARLKFGFIAAIIAATLTNGVLFALVVLPVSFILVGGSTVPAAFGVGIASVIGTCVASAIACSIGVAAHQSLAKTNMVKG